MSSPEDIPEDRQESYPCQWSCDGSVVLCRDNKWRCDKCGCEPVNEVDLENAHNMFH
jgi:hypothetical protein